MINVLKTAASALIALAAALLARARRRTRPCEPDCVLCALAADWWIPARHEEVPA